MKTFKGFLQNRLNSSLPGSKAQKIMAPSPLNQEQCTVHYEPTHGDFRNSSVLIPIIGWKKELEIVLTVRTASIKHGGQISFPGGGREGNETIEETALREAQEEIGLFPEQAEVIGRLTPLYIGHSDSMVTPVVAYLNEEQKFTSNPNEVDEIFTVALTDLMEENNLFDEEWNLRGMSYNVPFWNIHRVPLWGATAMMMSELIEIYKEFEKETSNTKI